MCLDSCHLLASGYDIRTRTGMDAMMAEFARGLGSDRLGALHLNDSVTPLGSNRDRHANIGAGELGEQGCTAFLSAPACRAFRACWRPPERTAAGPSREEVAYAMKLHDRAVAARKRR